MNQDEINTMVNRISSIWTNFLNPPSPSSHYFLREIKSNSDLVRSYEQPTLLEQAMEVIPLQDLYEKAETKCIDPDHQDLDDQIIQQLLHWFKHDFFHWVDEPLCELCLISTKQIGQAQTNAEDRRYGAGVVELYQCPQCHSTLRFPRYNDPGKLLQTRKGRCGEWANCFTLCCRAVGVEARLVLDKTDHVWTEVYSTYQNRWIHCDPCEDAFDRPMMYSVGWNKQLTYCIGFSADEVVDVTRRYVKEWPQQRQLINEQQLANYLDQLTRELQQQVDQDRRDVLKQRQVVEQEEFKQTRSLNQDDLLGRQSGSLAWRTARGEQDRGLVCSTIDPNVEDPRFNSTEKHLLFEYPTIVQLLGSAKSLDSKTWRLTTTETSQCGGLFIQQPITIINTGLEIKFAFRLTNAQGGPAFGGADGLAFVIQSNPNPLLGRGGCDLGYGGIRNSLAIEFDTYDSSDRCNDPSSNHISVHGRPNNINSAHHDYSLKHTSAIPLLNTGHWITCRIRYMDRTLEVALVNSADYDTVLTLKDVDLMDYMGSQDSCWIGFTASTGGLTQNTDIQWQSIHQYN
ncbi:hypothetical protein BC941DRAFT_419556 [Chlamydoabsidia padenii]|nr:hypothetical protein BC941DRAFT_419556 [Chlamydoabsidia padenii]